MAYVALDGYLSSHGAGAIVCSVRGLRVGGVEVAAVGDSASPDSLCPTLHGAHCSPSPTTGSTKLIIKGVAVHRVDDLRSCGGTTVGGPNKLTVL